jgi:hypothetical protein
MVWAVKADVKPAFTASNSLQGLQDGRFEHFL